MSIPSVQQKVSHIASEELHEKLGTEVSIGSVEFELFNKVVLKNLYLEDQNGDTLFVAKRVSVGFDFLPLFKKKLIFSSVQLFTFQLNLNKETGASPLNLQFVLDAFASKDTVKKNPEIDLNIHTLNIRRGNFTYHVKDEPETIGKFNPKHLVVSNISAKIHLDKLTNDSIHATVNKLSMKDQSGLEIKRVLFTVEGSRKRIDVHKFELWLPNSHLQLDDFQAILPEDKSPDSFILQTQLSLDISQSEIAPKDLKALAPQLNNFKDKINLKGHIEGNYNDIHVSELHLNDGNHLLLSATINIKDLSTPEKAYIDGAIERFSVSTEGVERMINNFSSKTITIPPPVVQLGKIGFSGHLSGYFHDLKALGVFTTESGRVNVDVNVGKNQADRLFLKGHIQTPEFDVYKLFPEKNPYGKLIFKVDLNATQDFHKKFAGTVNADIERFEFKNHTYENIKFQGDFTSSSFKGDLNIDNPDGKLFAEGFFKLNGEVSEFDFQAKASHVRLNNLNLAKKYVGSEMSFELDANFVGNTAENLMGSILLKDFNFNVPEDSFSLDSLSIKASGTGDHRLIAVESDIIKAELLGAYSYEQIIPAVKQTMHRYLPAIIPLPKKEIEGINNFYLDVTVENTEKLSKILQLPFTLYKRSKLYGHYNHTDAVFKFDASLPQYKVGGMRMEKTTLVFQNSNDVVDLNIKGIRYGKFDVKTDFGIQLTAKDDILQSVMKWKNREEALYQGELSASTRFTTEKESPMQIEIDVKPTNLTFNDTTWKVHPSKVLIKEKRISIDHLNVENADQFVRINGVISPDTADYLYVDLNKVNLSYIFNSLVIPALSFGGIATGKATINDIYKSRKLTTNLEVQGFSFNDAVMGDLKLNGFWDNEEQGIAMIGRSSVNDTTYLDIDGMIFPAKKELSLRFDAHNANAAFLRKYLDNVTSDFSGKVSGKIHLHGGFKLINVEGNAFVRDGGFGINFLNTYYTFSDSVYLSRDRISLKNVTLYDKLGHKATANGVVKHKNFKTFDFVANIQAKNLLAFNASERQNPTFYGTAFGTGLITLRGTENEVNIDVSMRTEEKTKISLNFMDPADIVDYNFISFANKRDSVIEKEEESDLDLIFRQLEVATTKSNVKLNLILDVTPDAVVEMYVDPVSGDKIKARGKGKLQIQYGNKVEPKIYGNYTVESGTYNFSLQQVIYKDFFITDGSTISFRGDPYTANLNINAIYSVSASLGDLDHSFNTSSTAMGSVMVNCLLNIAGEMQHPTVKFGIALPNSSEELERQVKSLINTDEMMNRQIIFLLALGRFYTQESANTGRSNDFASVASSTLSSQLTSLLGSLSENLQIGTNIRTSNYEDYTDTEVKVRLSSQLLNNRLLINGNVGYKDNPTEQRSFVGDFDLEYKLTKNGDIRLKAYNHYNDRYYYIKSALTTQGVGVMFRRDFDNLYDLLKIKKKQQEVNPPGFLKDASDEDTFIRFKVTE